MNKKKKNFMKGFGFGAILVLAGWMGNGEWPSLITTIGILIGVFLIGYTFMRFGEPEGVFGKMNSAK